MGRGPPGFAPISIISPLASQRGAAPLALPIISPLASQRGAAPLALPIISPLASQRGAAPLALPIISPLASQRGAAPLAVRAPPALRVTSRDAAPEYNPPGGASM